jgi:hypothetical protein
MIYLQTLDDSASSKSADTGSAVHKAVSTWHDTLSVTASLAAMKGGVSEYMQADLHDAELSFRPYAADPRNAIKCETEKKVTLTLPAWPGDDCGPIYVRGTLDQIRDGRVWDVKTGKALTGWDMVHEHAMQLSAYTLAAGLEPGGFIRTYGYRVRGAGRPEDKPDGVFWESPWTQADCVSLLDAVRIAVAHIRAGDISLGPGSHCGYCPARGLDNCLPLLREVCA